MQPEQKSDSNQMHLGNQPDVESQQMAITKVAMAIEYDDWQNNKNTLIC